jgi:hypothetical protein
MNEWFIACLGQTLRYPYVGMSSLEGTLRSHDPMVFTRYGLIGLHGRPLPWTSASFGFVQWFGTPVAVGTSVANEHCFGVATQPIQPCGLLANHKCNNAPEY